MVEKKYMFKNIELWKVPAQQLHSKIDFECEMSHHDHSFLCGMIKHKKPKKIVEIGVAAGGTTAVIVNALSILDITCEVYSVDLSITLWSDQNKKTGYEYKRIAPHIDMKNIKHQLLLGKTIAGQIDLIGNDIDFVVIDTAHSLPGEILDFLCVLPYLSEDAVVVLHDVNLNYEKAIHGTRNQVINSSLSVATKLLFSTVVADKYMSMNNEELPNIAAFSILKDTYKYITDMFYLLTLSWAYIPSEEIIKDYRTVFKRHYSEFCIKLFDISVLNNKKIWERKELAKEIEDENIIKYRFPYQEIPYGSRVVLYGAGAVGRKIYEAQKKRKLYNIIAWVDKKYEEYIEQGLEVAAPDSLLSVEYDYIVVAVEEESVFCSIRQDILAHGWDRGKVIIGPMSKF